MKALCFERFGGPEVLDYRELPDPVLRPGTVQVRLEAAGLNFADIYRRRGTYVLAGQAPYIAGYEGAGVVVEVGAAVEGIRVGDRIGFADVPFANATLVNVPADHVIPLPGRVSTRDAAAILLQGLTALYLVEDSAPVGPGHRVLIHAAAGGVGQLLVRLCRARGATVIALASTPAKRDAALAAGADTAIGQDGDWVTAVRSLSDGGADIVFDSVGTTLPDSIAALRPKGRAVIYGTAAGNPPPVLPADLMADSKGIVGGDLWSYLDSAEERRSRAARLFTALERGEIVMPQIETFTLEDGASAHRKLESRAVIGKIVLVP